MTNKIPSIQPVADKPPFVGNNDTFYCNLCKTYTPDFSPANVKRLDRRCRQCLSAKRFKRMQQLGHLQRLKLKLYQNLMYQNKKRYARSVTIQSVATILLHFGIRDDEVALVKTLKPTYDPVKNTMLAIPVFYNVARLAKD
mmetsp:Transcript_3286/g.6112  ORF Transcript_3286/g.6112 Transcript_3286/m.6112 type:complete len:141 (+) Transcript_3286:567-989(+)